MLEDKFDSGTSAAESDVRVMILTRVQNYLATPLKHLMHRGALVAGASSAIKSWPHLPVSLSMVVTRTCVYKTRSLPTVQHEATKV